MRRRALVVLVLAAAAAQADDQVTEVAAQVVDAVSDGADARLARLAARDDPDPWLVAEVLCFWRAEGAATAYAAAVGDEKLAGYVASRRGGEACKKVRQALVIAEHLRMAGHTEDAWAILSGFERVDDPVLEIRVRTTQAEILRDLDKQERSVRYFLYAGKLARGLGWRRRAAAVLRRVASRACLSKYDVLSTRSQLREGEATVGYGSIEGEVLATVVTTGRVTDVPLGKQEAIEAARDGFAAPEVGRPVNVEALHESLVQPLELRPEIRRLFIVTESAFADLPFVLFAGDREIVYGSRAHGVTAFRPWKGDHGKGVLAVAMERRAGDEEAVKEARAVADTVLAGASLTLNAIENEYNSRRRWRAMHVAGPSSLAELVLFRWPLYLGSHIDRWKADLIVVSTDASPHMPLLGFCSSPRRIHCLWRADPEATRALMTRFYELWNGKVALPACTALKRAQDHVRSHERWKHPYYWAGWQLWASPDRVARPQ